MTSPHPTPTECLTTVDSVGMSSLTRYANYLRTMIVKCSDECTISKIAEAMGRLAIASGADTGEYVEFGFKRLTLWKTIIDVYPILMLTPHLRTYLNPLPPY